MSIDNNENLNDRNWPTGRFLQKDESESKEWSVASDISYRQKFKNRRSLSLETGIAYSNSNQGSRTDNASSYYDEYLQLISEDSLMRNRNGSTRNLSGYLNSIYYQPIGKFSFIRPGFSIGFNKENIDQSVTEDLSGENVILDGLTGGFVRHSRHGSVGLEYMYIRDNFDFNIGIKFKRQEMEMSGGSANFDTNGKYNFWLPSASMSYKIDSRSRLGLNYGVDNSLPDFDQTLLWQDDTNPQRVFFGNPELDPTIKHELGLNYSFFDSYSSITLMANIQYSLEQKPVIRQSSFDEFGREMFTYVNDDLAHGAFVNVNYSMPLKFMGSRLKVRYQAQARKSAMIWNDDYRENGNLTQTLGWGISNIKTKVWSFRVGGEYQLTKPFGEVMNGNTRRQSYDLDLKWRFAKGWRLGTSGEYRILSADFQDTRTFSLLNAFVEKKVLKGDKGLIRLSVNDILDSNQGIRQSADAYSLYTERTNAIGRYFMLSFRYNISMFGK